MKKVGIFYAHRARLPDEDLSRDTAALAEVLKPRFEARFGEPVTMVVTPGKWDFSLYFQGDWNEWAASVASRKHAVTGRPLYDLFVCPDDFVGRATAHMLITAMGTGKRVFRFEPYTRKLSAVHFIACIDDDNWSSGYQLITVARKKETPDAQ